MSAPWESALDRLKEAREAEGRAESAYDEARGRWRGLCAVASAIDAMKSDAYGKVKAAEGSLRSAYAASRQRAKEWHDAFADKDETQ